MTDSVLCTACRVGVLRAPSSSSGSSWVCTQCGTSSSDREVNNRINHWWNIIQESDSSDTNQCLDLLDQLARLFHHNHYYLLEMKRRVVENISRTNKPVSIGLLEKSVRYCKDHLEIQASLAPGLSEYRAYISYHMARALYSLIKEQHKDKMVNMDQVVESMTEVCEHLLVVITIWGQYRTGSYEKVVANEADSLIGQVKIEYLNKI